MTASVQDSPPFGEANLTNCERELIHLAGSVQPHGLLLALSVPELTIRQASANTTRLLGVPVETLLEQPFESLGGTGAAQVMHLLATRDLAAPTPLQCVVTTSGRTMALEGSVHRHADGGLIVELEPARPDALDLPSAPISHDILMRSVSAAVQRFSAASSIGVLADAVAQCVHDLTGYDRVMVYKFDPDGHGKIIAESRDPRLASLLGHHYPASDIPQRARELYLRTRVRMLVDVHYEPVPLVPRQDPATGRELDMSLCQLRSMSPLHLQYLKNMGVAATLVVSLVREGRLWGLIAAHHYAPRHLRCAVRTACDLLAEVISTRIAAIENYAHAQVAILVRRLEQRLVEATSIEGDWRLALFRNPGTLLQPLEATGAALFHDGEILTTGEVPSTPELRALMQWVDAQPGDLPFTCSAMAQAHRDFQSLKPMASGVLAVRLSATRPDYLMWFRKEQLQTVTWAGDPTKPTLGDSPLELSPRRSFAAWSEIVRGTAVPWSGTECALARAIGVALVDIIVQVHAVRLLIGEHQLVRFRSAVDASREPVTIADATGRLLFSNSAFIDLTRGDAEAPYRTLADFIDRLVAEGPLHAAMRRVVESRQPCRGQGVLRRAGREALPIGVRTEVVPGRDGNLLGFVVTLTDLSERQRAADARRHLEQILAPGDRPSDDVIRAILTNASVAALDIADGPVGSAVAPLLGEVEESTQRARTLYEHVRSFQRSD